MSEIQEDDDDDDDEIILDHKRMIPQSNSLGLNQFNIGLHSDTNQLSKGKRITLFLTCLSIGMIIGLLGGTLPYLSQQIPSVIWMITMKSIGFVIGISFSSHLFSRFNIYCLLGISCITISFSIFSLSFIVNKIIFYFLSLILGLALAITYNGINTLYNYIWYKSSIRWLHIFITLGALVTTILLLPSIISSDKPILLPTTISRSMRVPREITTNTSEITSALVTAIATSDLVNTTTTSEITSALVTAIATSDLVNTTTVALPTTTTSTTAAPTIIPTITTTNTLATTTTKLTTIKKRVGTTIRRSTTVSTEITQSTTISSNKSSYSMIYIRLVYAFVALSFFILAIVYIKFALYDQPINSMEMKTLNPLSLIFIRASKASDQQSNPLPSNLIFSILVVYLILFGIEHSCSYLTYSLGIQMNLDKSKSLFLQLSYFFGRFSDILLHYLWFSISNQVNPTTISYSIFIRTFILSLLCLFNIFQHNYYHFLFFFIGFLFSSISSLFLYWIERCLSANEYLLRMIFLTTILSESIFPVLFYYLIEYFLHYSLLIALCLLIILFRVVSYLNKTWQERRFNGLSSATVADFENENL